MGSPFFVTIVAFQVMREGVVVQHQRYLLSLVDGAEMVSYKKSVLIGG